MFPTLFAQVTAGANEAAAASEKAPASMTEYVDRLWSAFNPVIDLLPAVVAMLVVLVVGYVVALLLSRAATAIAERVGLQKAAEKSGLVESMNSVGIQRSVPSIVGRIVFWLLMCVVFMAAFNLLNLPALSGAMQTLVAYIPRLLAATVVVVLGLAVASFLRGIIATGADRAGLSYGPRLAAACYYMVALMTFIAAFDQLDIQFDLFKYVILIAFGALALGFGLALGLGGREVIGGILAGYYVRQRLQAGDSVQVAGLEGTVREVGPVATVIETRDHDLVDRHTVPNTRMLNEAIR